ncbi:oxygenase MpaB family protein [Nonomuraea turcica]|uniref:oxygenase MpaB family protein n=1 Tax=Nonomuraea sp. G32 TaxID=3067274 RepID=UPI00273BE696|nr:oxygenase MpaB family protein [Nonomuraea sp. G32]MDP4508088.1 oxygenase MpaB family protein [Nonomuraea sp. G32]
MKATVTSGGGLFGPTSITWRIHTEPLAWPAVLRAFQLQALHPRTIRGIAQNCLLDDPEVARERLRRQLAYLTMRTFGTREQAEQAAERVRRVHARLIGLDTDTGTLFRVDDEENLRWVHCVETSSHLEVALRAGVPLTGAEADAYVAEQRRSASLVGLRDVPGDVAELHDYLEGMRPYLSATDEARDALRRSLSPQLSLRLLWPWSRSHGAPLVTQAAALRPRLAALCLWSRSLPAAGALAFATLPAWAKEMYGCHAGKATEYAAGTALKALRVAAAALPERLVAPEIRAARGLMRALARAPGADVAA